MGAHSSRRTRSEFVPSLPPQTLRTMAYDNDLLDSSRLALTSWGLATNVRGQRRRLGRRIVAGMSEADMLNRFHQAALTPGEALVTEMLLNQGIAGRRPVTRSSGSELLKSWGPWPTSDDFWEHVHAGWCPPWTNGQTYDFYVAVRANPSTAWGASQDIERLAWSLALRPEAVRPLLQTASQELITRVMLSAILRGQTQTIHMLLHENPARRPHENKPGDFLNWALHKGNEAMVRDILPLYPLPQDISSILKLFVANGIMFNGNRSEIAALIRADPRYAEPSFDAVEDLSSDDSNSLGDSDSDDGQ